MNAKTAIAIEFDGIIHQNLTPFRHATIIPDLPVPGAFEAIAGYINAGLKVYVWSARCTTGKSRAAIRQWFIRHGAEPLLKWVHMTHVKPTAAIYLCPRGLQFSGTFPAADFVKAFRPWKFKPEPLKLQTELEKKLAGAPAPTP